MHRDLLRHRRDQALSASASLHAELAALVGRERVREPVDARWLRDATESRGLAGRADAVVLPAGAAQVAAVVEWCARHGVPVTPRGGGTGFAGGAVPVAGGVVLALEGLRGARLEAERWRMRVGAGLHTAEVRRLARESGLVFPPDPGAAEQSQIGGNVATNAGGPHAFKYGATGAWVTGLEAVLGSGELVRVGGPARKDVAGYDLRSLLVGSEGTLGVITAAWLRLLPAPEAELPVLALYPSAAAGCAAVERVLASGLVPAALEFLDAGALRAAGATLPGGAPSGARMLVLAEADGARPEAERLRAELAEALAEGALVLRSPEGRAGVAELWRWRDGVSIAVTALRGGKVSEDICVPVERLCEAVERTVEIGRRHGLEACSWGHAGDGNLHSTFLVDRGSRAQLERAERAAADLFELAHELGGSLSGEHGVGAVKRAHVAAATAPALARVSRALKAAFDPHGVLNPGKKLSDAAVSDLTERPGERA